MAAEHRPVKQRTRWKWPRRILVLVVLLAGLAFLAPSIVARTGLRDRALAMAGDKIGLRIEMGRLQLGWLSSIRVEGLKIATPEGEELLAVKSLATELPLWKLVWRPRQFGEIRVEGAAGQIRLREGGSNWEDALAKAMQRPEQPAKTDQAGLPRGHVVARDSRLTLTMEGDARVWDLQVAHLEARLDDQQEHPLAVNCEAELSQQGGRGGQLRGDIELHDAQAAAGRLRLQATTLPLGVSEPLCLRLGLPIACDGEAGLNIDYQWADHFASHHVNIEPGAALSKLRVAAPKYLGPDVLALERLACSGDASWQGDLLKVRQLKLDSEIGGAIADGEVRLAALGEALASGRSERAMGGEVHVKGGVNLAELARLLPNTLRVREDAQITGGQLTFAVSATPLEQGCRWTGRVVADKLTGVTAGRKAALREPVSIDVEALQQGPLLDVTQFACRASFLSCDGRGSLAGGSLKINADLQALHQELSQFVDLSAVQLGGRVDGNLQWDRGDGRVRAGGSANFQELRVELPGYEAVNEPSLSATVNALATWDSAAARLTVVEQGKLHVQAAGDVLDAELIEPATLTTTSPKYAIGWSTQGDIDRWLRRAQPFFRLTSWNLAGNFQGSGRVVIDGDAIQVGATNIECRPLRARSEGIAIDEPRVQLQTVGVYGLAEGRWQGGPTTLVSATVAGRSDNLQATLRPTPQVQGDISLRGDLERINAIFDNPQAPRNQRVLGNLEGVLSIKIDQQGVGFHARNKVVQLAIAQCAQRPAGPQTLPASVASWDTVWSEPELQLEAQGVLESSGQSLRLSSLLVGGEGLRVAAQGTLRDFSTATTADLQGDLTYDLARLLEKLRHVLGQSIRVEGTSSRPFTLQGPVIETNPQAPPMLTPSLLTATGGVGWDRANFSGLEIGPGQVQAKLAQGVVNVEPISFNVIQGRLQMTPSFDLRGATPRLTLQPGRIAEGLTIQPEMCQTWLKYVAPLVADATAVKGVFSADIARFEMPISDIRDASVQGKLLIQEAKVGPGPLSQNFLQIAQQVESLIKGRAVQRDPSQWLQMPPQEVEFELRQGKVVHRGLRIQIDDLEIRTSGEVGLDQSLGLVAELILPQSWVDGKPYLAGLANGGVKISIGGTLQRPQFDRGALAKIGQQAATNAARGVIEGELDKALKKLFK